MRHLNFLLTACAVFLAGPACVDLTRPHPIADAGDGSVTVDAAADEPPDVPTDSAPDESPPDAADGGEPDGDAADGPAHGGLVGYWKLDSNTGGVAIDSSGMGNDGQIKGVPSLLMSPLPSLSFRDPAAFTFAAFDDAVLIPDAPSLNPPTELTVALWVRFTSPSAHTTCGGVPTGLQYMFHKRTSRTNGNIEGVALIRTQDNKFGFILGNSQGDRTEIDDLPSGTASVSTGVWYHVAGTFGTNQARLYVNGVLTPNGLMARDASLHPINFGTTPVFLARSGECVMFLIGDTNWDAELDGSLDDVRFYNKALSAAEVQMLYQGLDF